MLFLIGGVEREKAAKERGVEQACWLRHLHRRPLSLTTSRSSNLQSPTRPYPTMKTAVLVALFLGLVAAVAALGGTTDDHGCYTSAGYQWCEREDRCVRMWELAAERDFEVTAEAFEAFCSSPRPVIGGSTDEHGCLGSAGYQWCEREDRCVRMWELAAERDFEVTAEAFEAFCSSPRPVIGGSKDEHGCLTSAGYQWCAAEARCVRMWEDFAEMSPELAQAYCAAPPIGSFTDAHGCRPSAGYQWCAAESRCVRMWELANELEMAPLQVERYCAGQKRQ